MSAKCTVTNGKFIEPCSHLSNVTEFGNPRLKSKGVWCYQYYSQTSHEPSRRFFGCKSGDRVEKGMAFNFCPFCGTDISAPFTEPEHQEVTQ